jgi:[pyruvate, water dikinase]-phosphate phosphotransferase / [pyruvate, water dikinase] kinase
MKPTVYILSGGSGTSGEQVVHTILAQFPDEAVRLVTIPHLRYKEQLNDILTRATQSGAIVVHTLVEPHLREYLVEEARRKGVEAIDLMGPLIERLSDVLGIQPKGEPGLFRRLNQPYYDRVAAIDFAMAHDDGRNPGEWGQAEIVLVGVSRSGKTPLSLYLSVLGWKVANVPVVPGLKLPEGSISTGKRTDYRAHYRSWTAFTPTPAKAAPPGCARLERLYQPSKDP